MARRRLALVGVLLLHGCLYHVAERTDQNVSTLLLPRYDSSPAVFDDKTPAAPAKPPAGGKDGKALADGATDVRTAAWLDGGDPVTLVVQQAQPPLPPVRGKTIQVPLPIPGSEAKLIELPGIATAAERAAREREVMRLYPELPPLPKEPTPLPGPDGHPYTLTELQHIAAENSPTLMQAASDVEAARGNLITASAYPNPTLGLVMSPSSDGSTPGVWGLSVAQTIKTGGKIRIAMAAAQKQLDNAELALRRARSDLATKVRTAYFAFIVAKESLLVTKSVAEFTDEIYRFQAELLMKGGVAAPYEPAALRAQAYTARLAYQQAIANYDYAWKQLITAINKRQLPLSEVAGRVDRAIPYFDYDAVLAHVVRNHTDILTAQNGLEVAQFNLKAAQVVVVPDMSVNVTVQKDFVVLPRQVAPSASLGVPFPLWDQNKGNVIAAEAALVRAAEEPHRVELNLTTNLATAYANYRTNLEALEYYRKYILPDQVRTFRGTYDRRRLDTSVAFSDVVGAQQNLTGSVTTYLGILGQLWSSVVTVADFLQTDDLFQLAQPRELPPLPDLEHWPLWPCHHPPLAGVGMSAQEGCLLLPASGAETIRAMPRLAPNSAPEEMLPAPAPADRRSGKKAGF